jgi:hypothetical protein
LTFGNKNHKIKDHPHIEEVKFYWKSLREEKHNEKAEFIKKQEKEEINYMNWLPIKITEIISFLCKTPKWKSPGSDQILDYWLKAFPATHRYIKKIFN